MIEMFTCEINDDMNKIVVVMTAKGGKAREAIAAAKAIGEYYLTKYDLKYKVYMQGFGGTLGTIYRTLAHM